MDAYVVKPLKSKELLGAIESVLFAPFASETEPQDGQDGLIDMAEVLERAGGDMELVIEVAGLFLDDYPRLLSEMEQSIEQGDREMLRRSAHTLKGSAANIAAKPVAEAALKLEMIDMAHAVEAYMALENEIDYLRPLLVKLRKGRSYV